MGDERRGEPLRVCTECGHQVRVTEPDAPTACTHCSDTLLALDVAADRVFLRELVQQRRRRRMLTSAAIAFLPALFAMFPVAFTLFEAGFPVPLEVSMLLAWAILGTPIYLLYTRWRLSPAQLALERLANELHGERISPGARRWRLASSVPAVVGLLVLLIYVLDPVDVRAREPELTDTIRALAMIPAEIRANERLHTLLTAGLAHGSFLHVLSNVVALFFFGRAVDLRLGRWRTATVLVTAVLAGSLAHALFTGQPTVPTVGISGGVYGLAGAMLVTMPHRKQILPLQLPIVAPVWIVVPFLAVVYGVIDAFLSDNVAWLGHTGGLVAGAIVAFALRRVPETELYRDYVRRHTRRMTDLERNF